MTHSEFRESDFQFMVLMEFSKNHNNLPPKIITAKEEAFFGYDARVTSSKGVPIFYQFKRGNYSENNGTYRKIFYPTYYFFHTYPGPIPNNQHTILRTLANHCKNVFYVAPLFYTKNDFIKYCKKGNVSGHSKFIYVSKLIDLPDTKRHTICYVEDYISRNAHMYSEPSVAENASITFEELNQSIRQNINDENEVVSLEELVSECKEALGLDDRTDFFDFLSDHGIAFAWFQKKEK